MYSKIRRFNSDVHVFVSPVNCSLQLVASSSTNRLSRLSFAHDTTKLKERCRINASLFSGTQPLGWEVSDARNIRPTKDGRYDVIQYTDGTFDIGNFGAEEITKPIKWAYSPDAILIQNGEPVTLYATWRESAFIERHPRTLWGLKIDGSVVMCVVEGRSINSVGVTGTEAQKILVEQGCVHGFMNDGGGSSSIIVDGVVKNIYSDGSERNVVDGIFCYEKLTSEESDNIVTQPNEPTDFEEMYNTLFIEYTKLKEHYEVLEEHLDKVIEYSQGYLLDYQNLFKQFADYKDSVRIERERMEKNYFDLQQKYNKLESDYNEFVDNTSKSIAAQIYELICSIFKR